MTTLEIAQKLAAGEVAKERVSSWQKNKTDPVDLYKAAGAYLKLRHRQRWFPWLAWLAVILVFGAPMTSIYFAVGQEQDQVLKTIMLGLSLAALSAIAIGGAMLSLYRGWRPDYSEWLYQFGREFDLISNCLEIRPEVLYGPDAKVHVNLALSQLGSRIRQIQREDRITREKVEESTMLLQRFRLSYEALEGLGIVSGPWDPYFPKG